MFGISASTVASLLGAFGPTQRYRTFLEVWGRYKAKFPHYLEKIPMQDWIEKKEYLAKIDPQSLLQKLELKTCQDVESIAEACEEAHAILFRRAFFEPQQTNSSMDKIIDQVCSSPIYLDNVDKLPPTSIVYRQLDLSRQLFGQFKTRVNMAYGRLGETKYISLYQQLSQDKIIHQQLGAYREVLTKKGTKYRITGNIDGIQEKDGVLLEIKHRQKQLQNTLPGYEKVQILTYMYMLQKVSAVVVQCVSSRSGYFTEKSTLFFEPDYWNEVLERLDQCMDFLEDLSSNQLATEMFEHLEPYERQIFVNNHLSTSFKG